MILYFANRKFEILGMASSGKGPGFLFYDDSSAEEMGEGGSNLECTIEFGASRAKAERMTSPGNYILCKKSDRAGFYTIIDSELDAVKRTVTLYAEEGGLDLLNEIALPYAADQDHSAEWYLNKFAGDSGFEIRINEISALSRKLQWDGESTVMERILSVATQFDAEIAFDFEVKDLCIYKKYIDIFRKRGKSLGVELRLGRDVKNIIVKKSIANLATALYVTGGTPEGQEDPITLAGYSYDDGRFYLEGPWLKDREANKKWSRYLIASERGTGTGHIMATFSFDTLSQEELCTKAISHLKKISDTEVNFEVDIANIPSNVCLGDKINVVDDGGNLYLSGRLLRLETSEANGTKKATLGDYILKNSGISPELEAFAEEFKKITKQLYTWIVYADSDTGSGITLDPAGKAYMGIAYNRYSNIPDISDPSIFQWSKIKGDPGEKGENMTSYKIIPSVFSVTGHRGMYFNPPDITFKTFKASGEGGFLPCSCNMIIEHSYTTNPIEWEENSISAFGEAYTYTIPTGAGLVRCTAQTASGELLDQITIPVVYDGASGQDGADAVSYDLQVDAASVSMKPTGATGSPYLFTPSVLNIAAVKRVGSGGPTPYEAKFVVGYYYKSFNVLKEITDDSFLFTIPTDNGELSQNVSIEISMYDKATNALIKTIKIPVVMSGADGASGQDGADGEDATAYKMFVSAMAIGKNASGSYKQSSITVQGRRQIGSGSFSSYACRFKIETTTGSNLSSATWTSRYTSSSNVSSYSYSIPAGITGIRCSMYKAGGTSTLLDQVIIPVIQDGQDGSDASISPTLLASSKTLAQGGSFSVYNVKNLLLLEIGNASERSRKMEVFVKGVNATRHLQIMYSADTALYITLTVTWSGNTATVKCTRFFATGSWSAGTSQIYYAYTI